MNRQDERPNYGYWGKRERIRTPSLSITNEENLENSRIVWVGPMSRDKMIDDYDEYRHNHSETLPDDGYLEEVD